MIEKLIDQADELFNTAELTIDETPIEATNLFCQGIAKLFQAYLSLQQQSSDGTLQELYQRCYQANPSFEAIAAEIDLFTGLLPAELDSEDIVDAANEIWDFVIDLNMESE